MKEFEIPEDPEKREALFKEQNVQWLEHPEVVSCFSFYPVPDEVWKNRGTTKKPYMCTKFGPIAWKNRREIKAGDIILYDRSNYSTFSVISEDDLRDYWKLQVDPLPIGLFIHPPGKKVWQMKFTSGITWQSIRKMKLFRQPSPAPA
ncbi:MAG: hypothetical protein PHP03_01875 [Candidatus Pacebacteria bacterium]|nr:hypothetical protein [Candidatus Paceibacterota bacterium]